MVYLNPKQSFVYACVNEFIIRQEIVYNSIKELKPHLLTVMGLVDAEEVDRKFEGTYISPSRGKWPSHPEWNYILHGLGCLIVSSRTGEPIEWNASDFGTKSFNRDWLVKWIRWHINNSLLSSQSEDIVFDISIGKEQLRLDVFTVLDELVEIGLLKKPYPLEIPEEYVMADSSVAST